MTIPVVHSCLYRDSALGVYQAGSHKVYGSRWRSQQFIEISTGSMLSLIEGSECELAIRLLHKDSRLAENILNHICLTWSVLSATIYTPDSSFTSVCTVQSLADPRSAIDPRMVWLGPVSVMQPHCSSLREPPVLNWLACALQSNQHSWSVTELQIYIYQSQDLSPHAWLVASC